MNMKSFDVKIGINPISWANDDLPALGGDTPLERILSEGSEIGYRGFELGNKFPREPEELRLASTFQKRKDFQFESIQRQQRLSRFDTSNRRISTHI